MQTSHNRRVQIRVKAPIATGLISLLKSLANFNHSSTLAAEVFLEARGKNKVDTELIKDFTALTESVHINTLDKLSVHSNSITQFLTLCEAVVTPTEYLRLQTIILHFAPLYLQIFRRPATEGWLREEVKRFNSVATSLRFTQKLKRVLTLFEAEWPYRIPFTVALIPVPNREGATTGSSSHAIQFSEIKEGKPITDVMDVIFHELCHSFFHKKSDALAQALLKSFGDIDGNVPYFLLNEGLATALSQGWFEKERLGKLPDNRWYNQQYVDGFAKVLYPIILPFVENGRKLDAGIATEAVSSFNKTFPGMDRNPKLLLWNLVVAENTNGEFRKQLEELVPWGNYRYSSSPLSSEDCQTFFHQVQEVTGVIAASKADLPLVQEKYLPEVDIRALLAISRKKSSKNGFYDYWHINNRWIFLFVGDTVEEQVNFLKQFLALKTIPNTDWS